MSYSLTYTAGAKGKIKLAGSKIEVYHACRDIQGKKDKKVDLKADSIHPELTKYNRTYLFSKKTGKTYRPTSKKQIFDEMDRRFKDVVGRHKKYGGFRPVRKDAIAVREVILQLGTHDNSYYKDKYEGHPEKIASDKSFKAMMDWCKKTWGDRLLYFSIHVDEGLPDGKGADSTYKDYHPHVHVGLDMIDVDKDGSKHLRQKKVFKGPKQLQEQHTDFYTFMQKKGFDVDRDPAKTAQTRERLSQKDYNALRGMQERLVELDQREDEVTQREVKSITLKKKLDDEKSALSVKSLTLNQKEEDLSEKEDFLITRAKKVDEKAQKVEKKEASLKQKESSLQKRDASSYATFLQVQDMLKSLHDIQDQQKKEKGYKTAYIRQGITYAFNYFEDFMKRRNLAIPMREKVASDKDKLFKAVAQKFSSVEPEQTPKDTSDYMLEDLDRRVKAMKEKAARENQDDDTFGK